MILPNHLSKSIDKTFNQAVLYFGLPALQRVEYIVKQLTGTLVPMLPADPWQRPKIICPDISTAQWGNQEICQASQILESSYPIIKHELNKALCSSSGNVFKPHSERGLEVFGQWQDVTLKHGKRRFQNNCDIFPESVDVVKQIPRLGETVMFSAISPFSHITAHCGPWNCRLTLHLGLIIPNDCWIRVGAEIRTWDEGKCLVFDDSFEHEVWNKSKQVRVVLITDVWHPDLTDIEVIVLDEISGILAEG